MRRTAAIRKRTPKATRRWLAAIILTLTLLPALAQAQTYRWVDEHGSVHYTQGLQGIPERYRSQARPLDLGSAPAEKPLSPSPSLAPTVPLPAARPPSRWEPSGALPEITRVSFPRASHILVDAMINGQGPVKLALDTGSHQTHVSAQAVRTLGISARSYPCRSCEIEIIGGTKVVREVQILSLRVGDAEMTGPAFIDDTDSYDRLGAVGVLGRDFLDNFRMTIDSRQQVVTLVPATMSGPGKHGPSFAAAPAARIPFPSHPYILVSSTINGRGPITLILDTGAPRTRLSAKALRSLGISPKNAESREGRAGKVRIARVDVTSVEVGAAKVGPLRIGAYVEMETVAGADGLLGLDFLKNFTVTIDPGERVVTLEGARALEGPSEAPAGIPPRLPQSLWVVVLTVLGFWVLRRLQDFLMPRPSRGRFFLFFRPIRGMLTPLRELLDYPSSKTLGGHLEGNRLRGQFRDRAVVCSLIGTGWGSLEFRITLSCQSRWRFVASRRTGFSFAEWMRGLLPVRTGNVVFEVGDVERDRNFRFARWVDKTMGIDPREPCAAWLRRPEVRQGVEALLLSHGATRLGTLDDPMDFIQDLEAWHRSGAPIPDGLQVTYSPCRKQHLEVGNVRAVLEELEKLAQSLPTSLGPWKPSFPPRVGLR